DGSRLAASPLNRVRFIRLRCDGNRDSVVSVKGNLMLALDAADSMLGEHRVRTPCKIPPSIASEHRLPRSWQRPVLTGAPSKGCREQLHVGENLPVSLVQKSQTKQRVRPKSRESPTREEAMADFKTQWSEYWCPLYPQKRT